MRLNDSIIATPIDNPGQYDPDWRNSIAMGLLESDGRPRIDPAYGEYLSDPWIGRQLAYYRAVERGARLTRRQAVYRTAALWFQGNDVSGVRFRLEPLLLTAAPYKVIALDITGDDSEEAVGTVEAYEKLYFNIRDRQGRLSRSCQLRQYFALPSGEFSQDTPPEQMWKMIGSLMGYDTLVSVWMWKDAHGIIDNSQEYLLDEMWRLAQSRLFMSMFADRVGHESMSKLLTAISGQQKMLREAREARAAREAEAAGGGNVELVRSIQGLLGLMSPVLVGAVAADVDRARLAEASEARMRAESEVDAVDLGKIGQNGVELVVGRADALKE